MQQNISPYEIDVECAAHYCVLGDLLLKKGFTKHACDAYFSVVALDPSLGDVHFKLGKLLGSLGKNSKAVHEIEKAIKLQPKRPKYYFLLGRFLLRDGNAIYAIKSLEHAIALKPDFDMAYFKLSEAHYKCKEYCAALKAIDIAIELVDTKPNYHYMRGNILKNLKNSNAEMKMSFIKAELLSPHQYPFSESVFKLQSMIESGKVAIIPAGFRCYTKSLIANAFGVKQFSLPFDSGFFPPQAIASVIRKPQIKLKYPDDVLSTHTVCVKHEKHLDEKGVRGIKFISSSYEKIRRRATSREMKGVNKYLDSTFGYYTLDMTHKFVLAHYNWHDFADPEKSNNIHSPVDNIPLINDVLNKRIRRMMELCKAAEFVFFVVGEYKDYEYMMIDEERFDLNDFSDLKNAINDSFDAKCFVKPFKTIDSADKVLSIIGD